MGALGIKEINGNESNWIGNRNSKKFSIKEGYLSDSRKRLISEGVYVGG